MGYEAVVFDLFGTLIDFLPDSQYEINMGRMSEALGADPARLRQAWLQTSRQRNSGYFGDLEEDVLAVARIAGCCPDARKLTRATEIRLEIVRSNHTPREDAIPTLATLRGSGLKLGLLSDTPSDTRRVWNETEFAGLFHAVVLSCECGMCKPDRRMYELVCARLGVAAEKCLYVGDGGSGELSGGKSAGMHPVLISVGYDSEFDGRRADALTWTGPVISSLSEVLNLCGLASC